MAEYTVCGYDIKIIQNEMLKIMCAIDKVCRDNNIKYILDGGSMLGAVRHKGFIPWDDDADLAMPREDYEKFIKIANKELPPQFRFECCENTKEYPYNFGKVRAINTVFKEEYTGHLNINHGIYIDIFPMDYAEEKHYKKIARIIHFFTNVRYTKLKMMKFRFDRFLFALLPIKATNKIIVALSKYHYKKGNGLCKLCHHGPNKPIIPLSYFTDVIEVPFEGCNFYIPKEYDSFLTGRYGNYMEFPPEEKQQPCHELYEVKL